MIMAVGTPTVLCRPAGAAAEPHAAGATVGDALAATGREHTALTDRFTDPAGGSRSFPNVFVNGEEIRRTLRPATAETHEAAGSSAPSLTGGGP